MGLTLNTNLGAMQSATYLSKNYRRLWKSLGKLSSGLRINTAADDPAGLVISEQLRTRIASLNQEIENTSHLISKYQTASSSVIELRSQLTEIRTLAVAAGNEGVNDEAAQVALETTANHVVAQFNRTIDTAVYNGSPMFGGTEGSVADVAHVQNVDFTNADTVAASVAAIDDAISELDVVQIDLGATQKNELEARRDSLRVTAQNLQAAESVVRDVDYAKEFANAIASIIQLRASVSLMAHSFMTAKTTLGLLEMKI